jgi:hypothetical protein
LQSQAQSQFRRFATFPVGILDSRKLPAVCHLPASSICPSLNQQVCHSDPDSDTVAQTRSHSSDGVNASHQLTAHLQTLFGCFAPAQLLRLVDEDAVAVGDGERRLTG